MQVYTRMVNWDVTYYLNGNFGFENYLSIVRRFEHRKNITKLRISAHKLQIEVCIYKGTLPQNRVCHRCSTGEIDDEIHYLFKCVKFTQERAELNDQITLICQNINNLDDDNRLLWILNNENSIIPKALCWLKHFFSLYNIKNSDSLDDLLWA
jgi:hypothetical protein